MYEELEDGGQSRRGRANRERLLVRLLVRRLRKEEKRREESEEQERAHASRIARKK